LLPDAPLEILSAVYRAWVVDEQGRIVRTRYEIALWLVARDALRARRLYRASSHRYGDPAAWMMPKAQWAAERAELATVFDRPLDAQARLGQLQGDQERLVRTLQQGYETGVATTARRSSAGARAPSSFPSPHETSSRQRTRCCPRSGSPRSSSTSTVTSRSPTSCRTGADPLADLAARDYAARDFKRFS